MSTHLHHYTSAAGLLGILSSGNLHGTHVEFLNDSSENKTTRKFLRKELIKSIGNFVRTDNRFATLSPTEVSKFVAQEVDAYLSVAASVTEQCSPIFVCSFSVFEKSVSNSEGRLSQWRSYGTDGGYCIVFDRDALTAMLMSTDPESKRFAIRHHGSVDYIASDDGEIDVPVPHESAKYFLKRKYNTYLTDGKLAEKFRNQSVPYDVDVNSLGETSALIELTSKYMPFVKLSYFEEEQEYRFCVAAYSQATPLPGNQMAEKFKFKIRGQTVVPYVELFDGTQKLPVKRIIVGPHRMAAARQKSAKILLETYGYSDVPVTMSKIPLESVW